MVKKECFSELIDHGHGKYTLFGRLRIYRDGGQEELRRRAHSRPALWRNHVDESLSDSANIALYGPRPPRLDPGNGERRGGARASRYEEARDAPRAIPRQLHRRRRHRLLRLAWSGGSGHIAVNQMYVQYKVPPSSRVPVVMVHGADLSGKSYETTPDGRMGWEEYFVRKGHAVYLPDQISRARSGFDPTVFNRVHAGVALPSAQPLIYTSTTRTLGQSSASQPSAFPIRT